ncbi:CPBP family glutamic-type intramembrane protease [Hymenobacter sp. YC55]|uniref:CPBP family glutamic-type intramembrane protease n=1 Tax=Hymenobacter sp. YC55 TaxID=3034019 RepID=UPI0023F784B7|nr:CPBP family glutamic-type intramembrane protease [Hymenobacter sp. YC55]MDF7813996.1 CPBP family glutamic-type intramembrane protease [Hymenobacter sp. YC55]
MSPVSGATIVFWGLLWAGFCVGLCFGPWRAAPRLLGWAALACVVHLYTLWLVPPWTVWAYWLGLVPVTWLREMAWPAPLNWLGKSIGVLCSLSWVYAWRRTTPVAAGLVRPAPGSVRAITPAVLVVAVGLLVEAYASRYSFLPLTAVQHLYYLTLPGLDEEVFYRGALLGLLAPGLPRTLPLPGTRTSWGGVVGVLLFTLGHGLGYPSRLFELGFGADFWRYMRAWWSPTHFPLHTVLFQLGMGTFFLWVRERTGSTWVAAAVHCLMNGCLSLGHAAG